MQPNKINWKEVLNWSEQQIQDLKYVGYCYAREGQYETAITFFEGLIVLNPTDAYCLQTLGAIYLECGKYLQALNLFEKALKVDPNHPQTELNKAKTLLLLGYVEKGKKLCESLALSSSEEIVNGAEALLLAYASN